MKKEFNEKVTNFIANYPELINKVNEVLPRLLEAEKTIKKINTLSGATERANQIREEIKIKGWNTIARIYDPIKNSNDPAANEIFMFYTFIYEDMKQKGEIKESNAA